MKTYEFCKPGPVISDIQTVEFYRLNARPNDAWPEDAVLRDRDITRPQEITGTTTDPETGESVPVYTQVADKYLKWADSHLSPMLTAERTARDDYDAAQVVVAEAARQAAKPTAMKASENDFLTLCASLGFTGKAGFDELGALLEGMEDQQQAAAISIKLLSIDAAGKRYDARWWDDCAWHEEIA